MWREKRLNLWVNSSRKKTALIQFVFIFSLVHTDLINSTHTDSAKKEVFCACLLLSFFLPLTYFSFFCLFNSLFQVINFIFFYLCSICVCRFCLFVFDLKTFLFLRFCQCEFCYFGRDKEPTTATTTTTKSKPKYISMYKLIIKLLCVRAVQAAQVIWWKVFCFWQLRESLFYLSFVGVCFKIWNHRKKNRAK